VVGEASEVAREQADMVLLDSNFLTILEAVAEGRGIFDNIRKIVLYLVSNVFTEMVLVVGSMLAGWPLAITAVQILWVNLVGDGLPNLALTVDNRDPQILKRHPISPHLPLIDKQLALIMTTIGISTSLVGLVVFGWTFPSLGTTMAQTITFQILGVGSLFYVFSCRTLQQNIWEKPLHDNKWLIISVFFGLVFMVLPVYTPGLSNLLSTVPLGIFEWLIVLLASLFVIFAVESVKWIWKKF
jgi:Ca2+-transporting ATPase